MPSKLIAFTKSKKQKRRQSKVQSPRAKVSALGTKLATGDCWRRWRTTLNPQPSTLNPPQSPAANESLGRQLKDRVDRIFGRSLHIREVDAGSCNGCEIEIVNLNSPVYDLERFGIHFVASPRHADMLLVTGPVTRNMELALKKTYDATPDPRLVVAVGACGCSGGIFGVNYATRGPVEAVIPVDIYIPGCPPNPYALLHGILLAMGKLDHHAAAGAPRPHFRSIAFGIHM